MNLSLVSPPEKLALYLPEAGGLIKSQPLWGGVFIHFIYLFTQSDLHRGCLSNVQPPGRDKLSETLVLISMSLKG